MPTKRKSNKWTKECYARRWDLVKKLQHAATMAGFRTTNQVADAVGLDRETVRRWFSRKSAPRSIGTVEAAIEYMKALPTVPTNGKMLSEITVSRELVMMRNFDQMLSTLPSPARTRMLTWINQRYMTGI